MQICSKIIVSDCKQFQ